MRIVADANNWQLMDGDTDLEKKLNSYLTVTYIFENDVSSNECLLEAREILKLISEAA